MEEDKITMAGMVTKMLNDGQFSTEEEAEIKEMIEERQKKRKDSHKSRCLAEAVEAEMTVKMEQGIKDIKRTYKSVFTKCFKETSAGNMDSRKLTEKTIRELDKEVMESFGLNETEMTFFRGMLKTGLNKMADEGMLGFVPNNSLFENLADSEYRVSYIENPYTQEETEKIMKWTGEHPADMRGLALNLWFLKGISLTEIVNLTKDDCWKGTKNNIMKFDRDLFKVSTRSQIVWKALWLHSKEVQQVFVIPKEDNSGWKKLTELGLQRKLCYICQDIGIVYKSIHKNEAIKIKR